MSSQNSDRVRQLVIDTNVTAQGAVHESYHRAFGSVIERVRILGRVYEDYYKSSSAAASGVLQQLDQDINTLARELEDKDRQLRDQRQQLEERERELSTVMREHQTLMSDHQTLLGKYCKTLEELEVVEEARGKSEHDVVQIRMQLQECEMQLLAREAEAVSSFRAKRVRPSRQRKCKNRALAK